MGKNKPESINRLNNEWIYGPTGTGKSRSVRDRFPDLYIKQHNKWWDGYADQKTVLIDDLDKSSGPWIGQFLKLWGDHYPFPAEIKGSSILIRPDQVIVTSNWPMEDVFTEPNVLNPLKRRFK